MVQTPVSKIGCRESGRVQFLLLPRMEGESEQVLEAGC